MDSIAGLEIVQQPVQCCVSAPNEGYPKPIDPPPVLRIIPQPSNSYDYLALFRNSLVIARTSLISSDNGESCGKIHNYLSYDNFLEDEDIPGCQKDILKGQLVSNSSFVRGLGLENECYFAFPDLYVEIKGTYRLSFSLFIIPNSFEETGSSSDSSHIVISDPFVVYDYLEYPDELGSTELTKVLTSQGVLTKPDKETIFRPIR